MPVPTTDSLAVAKFTALFDRLRGAEQENARGHRTPVSFQVSDLQINACMRYAPLARPRPGLESVTVKVFPANYIHGGRIRCRGALAVGHDSSYPSPRPHRPKIDWLDSRTNAQNSNVTFIVEKAYYQSIWLPAFFANKKIQTVAARQPEKYDTSRPMAIPSGRGGLGRLSKLSWAGTEPLPRSSIQSRPLARSTSLGSGRASHRRSLPAFAAFCGHVRLSQRANAPLFITADHSPRKRPMERRSYQQPTGRLSRYLKSVGFGHS